MTNPPLSIAPVNYQPHIPSDLPVISAESNDSAEDSRIKQWIEDKSPVNVKESSADKENNDNVGDKYHPKGSRKNESEEAGEDNDDDDDDDDNDEREEKEKEKEEKVNNDGVDDEENDEDGDELDGDNLNPLQEDPIPLLGSLSHKHAVTFVSVSKNKHYVLTIEEVRGSFPDRHKHKEQTMDVDENDHDRDDITHNNNNNNNNNDYLREPSACFTCDSQHLVVTAHHCNIDLFDTTNGAKVMTLVHNTCYLFSHLLISNNRLFVTVNSRWKSGFFLKIYYYYYYYFVFCGSHINIFVSNTNHIQKKKKRRESHWKLFDENDCLTIRQDILSDDLFAIVYGPNQSCDELLYPIPGLPSNQNALLKQYFKDKYKQHWRTEIQKQRNESNAKTNASSSSSSSSSSKQTNQTTARLNNLPTDFVPSHYIEKCKKSTTGSTDTKDKTTALTPEWTSFDNYGSYSNIEILHRLYWKSLMPNNLSFNAIYGAASSGSHSNARRDNDNDNENNDMQEHATIDKQIAENEKFLEERNRSCWKTHWNGNSGDGEFDRTSQMVRSQFMLTSGMGHVLDTYLEKTYFLVNDLSVDETGQYLLISVLFRHVLPSYYDSKPSHLGRLGAFDKLHRHGGKPMTATGFNHGEAVYTYKSIILLYDLETLELVQHFTGFDQERYIIRCGFGGFVVRPSKSDSEYSTQTAYDNGFATLPHFSKSHYSEQELQHMKIPFSHSLTTPLCVKLVVPSFITHYKIIFVLCLFVFFLLN
ncbi:ubiquitin-protein ligase 1 [Reticulomyxa filosa]|uniref:Ubiquitin-protein ligase 1 n=1 Tax=Reticulomyxa filosa TaxID=46433 RepID=X6MNB5_RETFI|nr:ubiquitin-protein ligase 1 [Reticulomyxa filosa]|eukprot:ETO15483.1 ubiquitin-protein ligase 1 [Reticulomyxa filosa]